jgi:hypothetical protein
MIRAIENLTLLSSKKLNEAAKVITKLKDGVSIIEGKRADSIEINCLNNQK